ncbi:MAG: hypothetical protein JKY65_05315 [Planctomycetes bacterium]|nr:hypothetical protein [Planctomycetota bacterium]
MTRSLLFALAVLLSPLAAAEEALTPLETLAAAHSRGSSLLARGRASSDPIERGRLLAEGRRQLVTTLTKGKALVDQAVPTDDRAAESVRDQARYLVGRAALALSRSGSEDAARRLAQAEEAFRTLVEGRDDLTGTASDWLRHYAYLGLAESLAAGDSRGEARELAQDLTAIDWWYQPDKVPASYRKQVPLDRRHLERVCLEAHVLLARLLLEDGECARAIKVCAEIERAPHGAHWRRGAGAIDLISVRAQAAAALGDVEGAVRDLLALLQPLEARARASSAGAAVRDFRVGCLALAELSKLGEAAIRSPAGCFYAAFGHSRRGESGRSLQSYKRVLHTARTPNDRARWVPRAVREVGAVLFRQERYLEAALAYQIVFSEFPKDAFAPQAALFAIAALRRAVKQLGSPPGGALEDFKLLLLKGAEAHLSAEVRLRGRLADLAQDEGAKRWAKAAAGYVEISAETKAALRAKVLTRAGRCHWRDHLATRRVPPLTSARARLRESITLANSQGWTNEEAAARQTLARSNTSWAMGWRRSSCWRSSTSGWLTWGASGEPVVFRRRCSWLAGPAAARTRPSGASRLRAGLAKQSGPASPTK